MRQFKTHLKRGSCPLGKPVNSACNGKSIGYLAAQGCEWPKQLTSEFEEHWAAPHSHSRLLRARQDSHRSAGMQ